VIACQWAYSAFGDEAPTIAGRRFANVAPAPGDFEFNLGYMGMYRDKESGLRQNWNRYYDDRTGRYTQFDPIGLRGGWNGFIYANLNPLMFMDPTGLMGVGSGAHVRPGSSPPSPGANFTLGAGGSCHTPFGFGIGADAGFVLDTNGNRCVYSNVCYTVGAGMSASLGVVASSGTGPASSGTTFYNGAAWTGGAGLVGSGGLLSGEDGSASAGRGVIGAGGGASATFQSCRLQYVCLKN